MTKELKKEQKVDTEKKEQKIHTEEKEQEINIEEKEQTFDIDKKVLIRNLACWNVSFSWIANGIGGDITIVPNGSMKLPRSEILAHVQNGNRLFTGTDGLGSHATIFIDDAPTRIEVGFDSEDGRRKQDIFSEEKVKELFAIKKKKDFEDKFVKAFITRTEKYAVINAIKKLGLNEYDKIRFAEKYTGLNL